jgi:GTP-binding protein EngB required for normal cell division
LDQKNIPFDIIVTKIDKATQKELSVHMRLLKENIAKVVTTLPNIFPVSNITKRGREKLLEYIDEIIGLKLEA